MILQEDKNVMTNALDDDVLKGLLEQQPEMVLPEALKARMRTRLMDQVAAEQAGTATGFTTVRAHEGEWIQALPGAEIKILYREPDSEVITYLAKLMPGFTMKAHPHPYDEECIMLEGEMWLGDLHLKAGDYHFAAKGLFHGTLRSDTGALVFLKGALPA
jgi:quercetin dioxygenase-like cupin family protein